MAAKDEKAISVLSQIQAEIKCGKDLTNKFGGYNYRSAESILEALKPHLAKHNSSIILSDEIVEVGGRVYVKSTATFGVGFGDNVETNRVTAYAREPESRKGMDDSQITGATSSYARKYALQGLFALDDGQDADATNDHKADDPTASETTIKNILALVELFNIGQKEIDGIKMKLRPGVTQADAKKIEDWIKKQVKKEAK